MEKNNDIRHGRHCVFKMHVHLVFVTKYRREVFTKAILDDLHDIFASTCADFEAELVEFDGEDGHVHLLVNYPPKIAVSALVNSLKGVSSRMIRMKNYPSIRKKLWDGGCGRHPISPVAVAVRPSRSSASTSNNNRRRINRQKDGCAVRAILPRPEGRGLPRICQKRICSQDARI